MGVASARSRSRPWRCGRIGVGARLIAAALERARASGVEAIFVLGHPDYYSRFGFSADLAAKFAAPFAGANFMALELVPGSLSGVAGVVSYPPVFSR